MPLPEAATMYPKMYSVNGQLKIMAPLRMLLQDLMKEGHGTFMKERAPNDGHKKNIINKDHNWVGIGYYLAGGQFRYNEEFIDRYVEFRDIPKELRINETGTITIDTRGKLLSLFHDHLQGEAP